MKYITAAAALLGLAYAQDDTTDSTESFDCTTCLSTSGNAVCYDGTTMALTCSDGTDCASGDDLYSYTDLAVCVFATGISYLEDITATSTQTEDQTADRTCAAVSAGALNVYYAAWSAAFDSGSAYQYTLFAHVDADAETDDTTEDDTTEEDTTEDDSTEDDSTDDSESTDDTETSTDLYGALITTVEAYESGSSVDTGNSGYSMFACVNTGDADVAVTFTYTYSQNAALLSAGAAIMGAVASLF